MELTDLRYHHKTPPGEFENFSYRFSYGNGLSREEASSQLKGKVSFLETRIADLLGDVRSSRQENFSGNTFAVKVDFSEGFLKLIKNRMVARLEFSASVDNSRSEDLVPTYTVGAEFFHSERGLDRSRLLRVYDGIVSIPSLCSEAVKPILDEVTALRDTQDIDYRSFLR